MLEKPDLQDETILSGLRDSYGIPAVEVDFLPIGNDSTAWVYRVNADDSASYFLKVKRGTIHHPSVIIPRYLKDRGIEQVVAPLATLAGRLWADVDTFTLILFPFIDGKTGMEIGLTNRQWIEFGMVLRNIHSTRLPVELLERAQRETFIPKWSEIVRQLQLAVQSGDFDDPFEMALAAVWREKQEEIGKLVDRAEALGRLLQKRSSAFVLCHADIHTANLLIQPDGEWFIVDWDQPIFAPRERDLMFVVGGVTARTREEKWFFEGYGASEVDPVALAYYRYEWVVQEIGDYGERVFLRQDTGAESLKEAVLKFRQLFDPGDVVESAYEAEVHLQPTLKLPSI